MLFKNEKMVTDLVYKGYIFESLEIKITAGLILELEEKQKELQNKLIGKLKNPKNKNKLNENELLETALSNLKIDDIKIDYVDYVKNIVEIKENINAIENQFIEIYGNELKDLYFEKFANDLVNALTEILNVAKDGDKSFQR